MSLCYLKRSTYKSRTLKFIPQSLMEADASCQANPSPANIPDLNMCKIIHRPKSWIKLREFMVNSGELCWEVGCHAECGWAEKINIIHAILWLCWYRGTLQRTPHSYSERGLLVNLSITPCLSLPRFIGSHDENLPSSKKMKQTYRLIPETFHLIGSYILFNVYNIYNSINTHSKNCWNIYLLHLFFGGNLTTGFHHLIFSGALPNLEIRRQQHQPTKDPRISRGDAPGATRYDTQAMDHANQNWQLVFLYYYRL